MYDSYANQRQALAQIAQGIQSGAIQQAPTSTPTADALARINTPHMGQAGGYYDAQGNYRTDIRNNPAVQAGQATIRARQDAIRAAGGFNGSAPQTPYTPNQPGDPFLAFGTGNQPGGVMNNLPGTINNTQNLYNNGQYTGFGGSVLTASGGPVYNGGQSNGGQGYAAETPGGMAASSNYYPSFAATQGSYTGTPGYYAGMPQSNTRPTVIQGYVPTTQYPGAIAPPPVMPNLNRETRTTTAPVAPYGGR